jgi:hypothetical protein
MGRGLLLAIPYTGNWHGSSPPVVHVAGFSVGLTGTLREHTDRTDVFTSRRTLLNCGGSYGFFCNFVSKLFFIS